MMQSIKTALVSSALTAGLWMAAMSGRMSLADYLSLLHRLSEQREVDGTSRLPTAP